jgi:hypothetical protein
LQEERDMDWHRHPTGRWGLRPLGVVLLLGAYMAGRRLPGIEAAYGGDVPPVAYLLALIAFLCSSTGAALLVHGHRLFDRVEISERWRRRSVDPQRGPPPSIVPADEPAASSPARAVADRRSPRSAYVEPSQAS